ncbi:MAG: hypothetical protein MZV63_08755 [Marinilabiliales bacterium]|nr:hypothetical protein [Marinilabiliales bacterium]
MRTAHAMGIKCVAIRTSAEPDAMYLSYADIIHEEEDQAAEIPVFLDVEKLIAVALETKCDALHPGYGFLAENAYFADKCKDNRIIFIGPSPDAIYKMGNKPVARQIALKHKIPMAMGTPGSVADEDEALQPCSTDRIPGDHQGCLRRRRARHADSETGVRDGEDVYSRQPRGGEGIQRPQRIHREIY